MAPAASKSVKKSPAVVKKPPATGKALALQKAMQRKAKTVGIDPLAVLKCTEKAANGSLFVWQRCHVCHGAKVEDVIGNMVSEGNCYSMADLRYDLKLGRLELLKPGAHAGALPQAKPRPEAPLAGKPLPPASLDEFLRFIQCQLRMELREHTGEILQLEKDAEKMWPDVEAFATPNLGANERWVPYHTILGVHEIFLVQNVHNRKEWTEKQRFQAMFCFRAHCKRDLFREAQMPVMLKKAFWENPAKAFQPGGVMEQAILKYRKSTGKPLITSCFRIIPPRVLADDDRNLVRSITDRSIGLLEVADHCWTVLKDKSKTPKQKLQLMANKIQNTNGLGETWAKMLTVCIDLAYPKEGLLESQCEVGTGAAPSLRELTKDGKYEDKKQALNGLMKSLNNSNSVHAKAFWRTLNAQEKSIRSHYKKYPLVISQATTQAKKMSAVTLQVQLCEYRQFRHSVARLQYGLPDDESMRGEAEIKVKKTAQNFVDFDDKKKVASFIFPDDEQEREFRVDAKAVGGNKPVAIRVAAMCFDRIRAGFSHEETEKLRDEVAKGYRGGEDVPEDCEAWEVCRTQLSHPSPLVAFQIEGKDGKKFPFQTTVTAAGTVLEAERIARLCWVKLMKGTSKEEVTKWRNQYYKTMSQAQKNGAKHQEQLLSAPAKRKNEADANAARGPPRGRSPVAARDPAAKRRREETAGKAAKALRQEPAPMKIAAAGGRTRVRKSRSLTAAKGAALRAAMAVKGGHGPGVASVIKFALRDFRLSPEEQSRIQKWTREAMSKKREKAKKTA